MPDKKGELTFEEIWRKYGYRPPRKWSADGKHAREPKRDCFAYLPPTQFGKGSGRAQCTALDKLYCRYEKFNFYKKFGYDHKPGFEEPDEEMIYRLEKYR